jgi:hypothetical protein
VFRRDRPEDEHDAPADEIEGIYTLDGKATQFPP